MPCDYSGAEQEEARLLFFPGRTRPMTSHGLCLMHPSPLLFPSIKASLALQGLAVADVVANPKLQCSAIPGKPLFAGEASGGPPILGQHFGGLVGAPEKTAAGSGASEQTGAGPTVDPTEVMVFLPDPGVFLLSLNLHPLCI